MSAVAVSVRSYTHSVTYVTDNVLKSLKDIIVLSGLSPDKMVNSWQSVHRAMTTWINSGHLNKVVLEVYDPRDNKLITRWDVDIVYGYTNGDGRFWTDTDQLAYAIRKAGVWPSAATYDIRLCNSVGRPDVPDWGPCSLRSTDGFVRQSLGTTVEHSGLGGATSFYRKVS
jgi:hypothetical protein